MGQPTDRRISGIYNYNNYIKFWVVLVLPLSFTPEQSVRSSSSSKRQQDPRWSRLLLVSKLQDSNFRHTRFPQDFAMADIALSVRALQHVRSNIFNLVHPDTSRIIPVSVTPLHLLNPRSTSDLQLMPIICKAESESRAPSTLNVFRLFKFLNQCRTVDESSWYTKMFRSKVRACAYNNIKRSKERVNLYLKNYSQRSSILHWSAKDHYVHEWPRLSQMNSLFHTLIHQLPATEEMLFNTNKLVVLLILRSCYSPRSPWSTSLCLFFSWLNYIKDLDLLKQN